jgi:hypothetical protein
MIKKRNQNMKIKIYNLKKKQDMNIQIIEEIYQRGILQTEQIVKKVFQGKKLFKTKKSKI